MILLFSLATRLSFGIIFGDCKDFIRGDTNADGNTDLTDAIKTLEHLFLGDDIPCHRATDNDASGEVEITDVIILLSYQFLGKEPPVDPGPNECGPGGFEEFLSCDSFPPCGPGSDTKDLSDFKSFTFTQSPGLGFCPLGDSVYCASIDLNEDTGEYIIQISFQNNGDGTDPFCEPEFGEFESFCDIDCGPILRLAPRPMTETEVESMMEAFSSLTFRVGPDPICQCVAIDPCLIRNFTWDEVKSDDFQCTSLGLEFEALNKLMGFLNSFFPG